MRLVMVGLDHKTADVKAREAFATPAAGLGKVLCSIHADPSVQGCVLLSTCNRTELYLSYAGDLPLDGVDLLCTALEQDYAANRGYFVERHERQAVTHLMKVASGIQSSVLGDDQIVTQARTAIEAAREAGASDPLTETLFRCAITAAKKVKTSVSFAREGGSVAAEAVRRIDEELGGLAGRRALVIGNGVVGQFVALKLRERGCTVDVTIRNHRKPSATAPDGCRAVPYEDRHSAMIGCDVVISATSSPHLTVRLDDLPPTDLVPKLFVDLAVPRDIEPAVVTRRGVTLWNVDDLRQDGAGTENAGQLLLAEELIEDEARRFEMWRLNRRRRLDLREDAPHFPIFINLHGAGVLVAGGGKVAARRTGVLLGFGARVRVVSPLLGQEMEHLLDNDNLIWERREYAEGDMDGMTLAVAATDDREVNQRIGQDARERGILVSVADKQADCTFYFPAIIQSEHLTAGLVSKNGDHTLVRKAAARIREELEHIDENLTGGFSGEQAGGSADKPGYLRDTALSS